MEVHPSDRVIKVKSIKSSSNNHAENNSQALHVKKYLKTIFIWTYKFLNFRHYENNDECLPKTRVAYEVCKYQTKKLKYS